MSIELVMPSNYLILCHSFLLLLSVFPNIRVFSSELALHIRWPKYCSFSISLPMNIQVDILQDRQIDLLIAQGTLKSILQHHSLKASLHWCSTFFMVQLSQPYMTTGKAIVLIIGTFVGKVISLFFNMLPRFAIAFLPRRKHLLISQLQSPSMVILEPEKIKSVTVSTFSPSFCQEMMESVVMILVDNTGLYI